MRTFRTSYLRQALSGLVIIAASSVPAHASPAAGICVTTGLCGMASPIGEDELAAVAGKFSIAGEVVGMALSMASAWQSDNGQKLEARANLAVSLPNSGQARVAYGSEVIATEAGNAPALNATAGSTAAGKGLTNVNGVSQVIQVAGDSNGAMNRTSISVTTGDIGYAIGNGQSNAAQTAGNGAHAAVSIGDNRVNLALQIPGAGTALQQINAGNSRNIHQAISIAAHGQQVVNQFHMQIQMRPIDDAMRAAQGFANSINMLKGR